MHQLIPCCGTWKCECLACDECTALANANAGNIGSVPDAPTAIAYASATGRADADAYQ